MVLPGSRWTLRVVCLRMLKRTIYPVEPQPCQGCLTSHSDELFQASRLSRQQSFVVRKYVRKCDKVDQEGKVGLGAQVSLGSKVKVKLTRDCISPAIRALFFPWLLDSKTVVNGKKVRYGPQHLERFRLQGVSGQREDAKRIARQSYIRRSQTCFFCLAVHFDSGKVGHVHWNVRLDGVKVTLFKGTSLWFQCPAMAEDHWTISDPTHVYTSLYPLQYNEKPLFEVN